MHSGLNDTTITLNCVAIVGSWTVGLTAIALSFFPFIGGEMKAPVCVAGVPFIAFGAVRWLAQMLCQLERDQRNVFELGRDYERLQGEPPLHSVN